MKLKKYTAKTMRSAMEQMSKELGDDAVIISSREFVNDEHESMVELVAGLEEVPVARVSNTNNAVPLSIQAAAGEQMVPTISTTQQTTAEALLPKETEQTLAHMQRELKAMRDVLVSMNEHSRYKYSASLSPVYRNVYAQLRKAGISEDAAMAYIGKLTSSALHSSADEALREMQQTIVKSIRLGGTMRKGPKGVTVMLGGSSGAGKTLTAFKLAAICKMGVGADVLVISMDTSVGNKERCNALAYHVGVETMAVHNLAELEVALKQQQHRDFVFIDTPGASAKIAQHTESIAATYALAQPQYFYHVVSSETSELQCSEQIQRWKKLGATALIVTKLDEQQDISELAMALKRYTQPLAYLTSGTSLPHSIDIASVPILAQYVLPSKTNEVANAAQVMV